MSLGHALMRMTFSKFELLTLVMERYQAGF